MWTHVARSSPRNDRRQEDGAFRELDRRQHFADKEERRKRLTSSSAKMNPVITFSLTLPLSFARRSCGTES